MVTSTAWQGPTIPAPSKATEPPPSKPLDEAVWQAWVAKGRARDKRGEAARARGVTWVPIAALLVASAGLWSNVALYDTVIRFIVSAGSVVVMFRALRERRYALGAVLGALALVYNPVVPVFGFSEHWQRAVLLASTCPFVLLLIGKKREAQR